MMRDNLSRLKLRTQETDENILLDCLETAEAAIMARRYPYGNWPERLEQRYQDLQFRIALAIYNKQGGEFEITHVENGTTRTYSSEFIPQELLREVTPFVKITN